MKNLLYLAILPLLLTATTAYSENCSSIPNYSTFTKILILPCVSVNNSATFAFRVDMQGTESEAGLSFIPTIIELIPYVDISNPENPMEWVGKAHNNGVRFVLKGVRGATVDGALSVESKNLYSNILELTNDYFNVELTNTLDGIELSSEEAIAKALDSGAITDKGSQLLTEFFKILEGGEDEIILQILIPEIRNFEESISNSFPFPPVISGPTFPDPTTRTLEKLTEGQLTTNDLRVFYSVASIARHSAKLWAPKEQGGEGTLLRVKWWKLLLADVVGGVIGGVPGAVGVSTAVALGSD